MLLLGRGAQLVPGCCSDSWDLGTTAQHVPICLTWVPALDSQSTFHSQHFMVLCFWSIALSIQTLSVVGKPCL